MPTEIATPLELYVAELVNAARAEAGLPPVHVAVHLNSAAQGHSDWMSGTSTLSHTGDGGSTVTERVGESEFPLTGGSWHLSENVAYTGISGAPARGDVDSLHGALMNSPSHAANILDPQVDYLGIGLSTGQMAAGGGMHDVLYLTQNFASTSQPVLVQEEVDGQPVLTTYIDGEPVPGSSEPIGEADGDADGDGHGDGGAVDGNDDGDDGAAPEDAGAPRTAGGSCFVATAAYGDRLHPDVVTLRRLRDEILVRSRAGRGFIRLYWIIGPRLARHVRAGRASGRAARAALRPLVRLAARRLARHGRRAVVLAAAWRSAAR